MNEKFLKQVLNFFIVSGMGWIIDFTTYTLLITFFKMNVGHANMISSIPAITYVFIISNKKIFKNSNSSLKTHYKYMIYFIYQVILVTLVSSFGNIIYDLFINKNFINVAFIKENLKIFIKIAITPITMILNFITMKLLIEKL